MGFFERLEQNMKRRKEQMDKLPDKQKYNMYDITEAKRTAKKNALAYLSMSGVDRDLYTMLNWYYDNDWSDFGRFSNDYQKIRDLDGKQNWKYIENKIKDFLTKEAKNSSFGRALNKKYLEYTKKKQNKSPVNLLTAKKPAKTVKKETTINEKQVNKKQKNKPTVVHYTIKVSITPLSVTQELLNQLSPDIMHHNLQYLPAICTNPDMTNLAHYLLITKYPDKKIPKSTEYLRKTMETPIIKS